MKIEHEFTVHAPIETAWATLTDLEEVAPCMPGASLTGRDGDDYLGKVKVKIGPVTSEFAGKARFVERDDAAHRAVIDAQGRDVRGAGNASAAVTAQLRAEGDATVVSVDTDLKIAGKLAQFGTGMIQQVSAKLLGEFVQRLEAKMANGQGTAESGAPTASDAASVSGAASAQTATGSGGPEGAAATGRPEGAAAATEVSAEEETEALDLMRYAGGTVAKRVIPVVAGVVVVVAIVIYVATR